MNQQRSISSDVILVYYGFRGNAQSVRHLLHYLQIGFVEVKLQCYEKQKHTFPESVRTALKGISVGKNDLPALLHEGRFIYEPYPILSYICRRFNHQDLLGSHIQEKARLQEVMSNYIEKHSHTMLLMFKLCQKTVSEQNRIEEMKKQTFEKIINQTIYVKEMADLLKGQQNPTFVLGKITLLDFIFFENCFYHLGVFGNLDNRLTCPINKLLNSIFNCSEFKSNLAYIDVMRKFKEFFQNLPFFRKIKNLSESYKILCPSMNAEMIEGYKKIWIGPKHFLQ